MVTFIDQRLYSIKELYWEAAGEEPQKYSHRPKKGEAIQRRLKASEKRKKEPNQNDMTSLQLNNKASRVKSRKSGRMET